MQFNQTKESVAERTRTTNHEGGEAFVPDTPERGLLTVTINNLLEDSFYQSDEESLQQVLKRFDAAAAENPEFILKLAAYAREEMGLRDISQLLLVLSAHDDRVKEYVRTYAPAIMQRADEPATVIAMNDELFGVPGSQSDTLRDDLEEPVRAIEKMEKAKTMRVATVLPGRRSATLPKPLKKGINDALHQWDDHLFAKYSGERRQVNMKDVINRTHPKPQDDEHDEIFERVMLGELDDYEDVEPLEPAETWEVVLSERKTRGVTEIIPVSAAGSGSVNYGFDVGDGRVFVTQSQKTGEVEVSIPAEVNADRIKVATADGYAEQPPNPLSGEYPTSSGTGTDVTVTLGRPTTDVQLAVTVYIDQAQQAWEDVLPKMGLFAILRNLRNMLQAGVHEATILGELDLEGVRQSKLFPFRFYQAHKALKDARLNAPRLEEWLSDAIDISSENLPDRLVSTMVAVDLSGSMNDRLSERSDMTRREIGSLFGAILANKGAIASGFGSDFDLPPAVEGESTLEIMQRIERLQVGHSTNGWKAIKFLREGGLSCDRIVMFTDEQIWDSESRSGGPGTLFTQRQEEEQESHTVREEFKAYRDEVAPECSLYIINLASYGTLSTPEGMDGVFRIGGWSSQVLDFVEYAEKEDEIIEVIENYEVTE